MSKALLKDVIYIARNLAVKNIERNVKIFGPNAESIDFIFIDDVNLNNQVSIYFKQDDKDDEGISGQYCFNDDAVASALYDGYHMPDKEGIMWLTEPGINYEETSWSLDEQWVKWLEDLKTFVDSSLNFVKE